MNGIPLSTGPLGSFKKIIASSLATVIRHYNKYSKLTFLLSTTQRTADLITQSRLLFLMLSKRTPNFIKQARLRRGFAAHGIPNLIQ
jgi:hypothetical protein